MRMKKALLLLVALLVCQSEISACSMYKITSDGKTMVGCNHDTWFTTPKIWFENAREGNEYGAAFTGARAVHGNRTTPQSGMNTLGLTFSRLASYYPAQNNPFTDRLKVPNEADYLSDILHKCANVNEVREYIGQYDHSVFLNDVFIYIDSLGNYLIVEPYQLIEGSDPSYVLANFCPSITDNHDARKLERYRNGEDFLRENEMEASLAYCTDLSDTMHVCRNRIGDGTLTTSIWDTQEKSVHLYFYHSYDTAVQFSLAAELEKGDHSLDIQDLFPPNPEFERLVSYKTPSNTIALRISLALLAGLLMLLSFTWGMAQLWRRKIATISLGSAVMIAALNLILTADIAVLITNKGIFYFDVPYKDPSSSLISASSYTPFLLLLALGPMLFYTRNTLKSGILKAGMKAILVANSLAYLVLMLGFAYWGLINFWM